MHCLFHGDHCLYQRGVCLREVSILEGVCLREVHVCLREVHVCLREVSVLERCSSQRVSVLERCQLSQRGVFPCKDPFQLCGDRFVILHIYSMGACTLADPSRGYLNIDFEDFPRDIFTRSPADLFSGVRYSTYRQYTDLFIIRFVFQHCLQHHTTFNFYMYRNMYS